MIDSKSDVIKSYLKPLIPNLISLSLCTIGVALTFIYMGSLIRSFVDDSGIVGTENSIFIHIALAIIIISSLIFGRMYIGHQTGEKIICKLKKDIFSNLLYQDQTFFESARISEISNIISTETNILQTFISNNLPIALRSTIVFIGSLIMIVSTSPELTMYTALLVSIFILSVFAIAKKVKSFSREAVKRTAITNGNVGEILKNIKIIQSFVFEKIEHMKFTQDIDNDHKMNQKYILMRSVLVSAVTFLMTSSISLILWLVYNTNLSTQITPGDLSSFIFYSVLIAGSVNNVTDMYGHIQRAISSVEMLLELLNNKTFIIYNDPIIENPEIIEGAIEMDSVSFSYPSTIDVDTISDLSITIKPRSTVALVGHSGAGKSTIFNLLLRFYDYKSGTIKIDNIDIRSIKLEKLRSIFGSVEQEPVIFSKTIRENLLYGKIDATEAEIIEATKAAYAYEFINNMKDGLDTFVGENGTRLSVGQKQRLTIARIILQKPKILLLDEATSSLDAESESLIQQALPRIMRNCTNIIIAHRISTIVNADAIAVIDQGKIVEIGTHEELMRKNGAYTKLAKLQFLDRKS